MNLFEQEVRQKATVARSAKRRVSGSRGMTMAWDSMTGKQRKALNGPVKVFRMGELMGWEAFRGMPEDLQREYLEKLEARCGAKEGEEV